MKKIIISILFFIENANAHAALSIPPSRNIINYAKTIGFITQDNILPPQYCPHCMNSDNVCGDVKYNPYNNTLAISNIGILEPYLPQFRSTYTKNDKLRVMVDVTAHHFGHFEFRICDKRDLKNVNVLTQDCFKHLLVRDNEYPATKFDKFYPERLYLEKKSSTSEKHTDPLHLGRRMSGQYHLPDISCIHCIVQMTYTTANSCLPDGYLEYYKNVESTINKKIPICRDDIKGEKFNNCADIQISKSPKEQDQDQEQEQEQISEIECTIAFITSKKFCNKVQTLRKNTK